MKDYVETDTSTRKEYECPSCGSIYTVYWEPDEVDTAFSGVGPELCPFCGDDIEVDGLPEDLLDMNFADHAEFGKGIDLVDGDED